RYHTLTASELSKYSGVPQPKIYETMIKLHDKGFIDILTYKNKKLFKVKPKNILKRRIQSLVDQIKKAGSEISEVIDKTFDSEEATEIPFIGMAGREQLQENIYMSAENAKKMFLALIPLQYYDEHLIEILQDKNESIEVKLIFQNIKDAKQMAKKVPKIKVFQASIPILKEFEWGLSNLIQSYEGNPFFQNIGNQLKLYFKERFGLIVIDQKKSFFAVPMPVDLPVAILSSLSEIVNVHTHGMNEIIKSAKFIEI
ncbi:MAG: helix-turn-helix domain-containing protein, partial [Promethearchaeota archaeon]